MSARKTTKKQEKPRHVCTYCGAKRIETRMYRIPDIDLNANLPNGSFWACNFRTWWKTHECARAYMEQCRNNHFAQAEKYQSAIDKLKKYNK